MKAKYWLIYYDNDPMFPGRKAKPASTKECLLRWLNNNKWAEPIAITEALEIDF